MAFAVVRKGSGQEAFVFGDRGQSKVAVVTHGGSTCRPDGMATRMIRGSGQHKMAFSMMTPLDRLSWVAVIRERTGGEPLHGPSRDVFKRVSHANCLQAEVCIQFPLGQRIRGDFLGHVDQA